jgi:hypothetical protein
MDKSPAEFAVPVIIDTVPDDSMASPERTRTSPLTPEETPADVDKETEDTPLTSTED